MKVIIYGATGMVGQGVLRECLLDSNIELVLSVGRSQPNEEHAKLRKLVVPDLTSYQGQESQLTGFDACFFCLGTTSNGKTEAEYSRVTFDFTVAAAKTLLQLNPKMTFVYVSGIGADSTEKSAAMWARVRGKTENVLLQMPFKGVYIFRPALIEPMHGIESRTTLYRVFYQVAKPLMPILRRALPTQISSTENIGRAMISVAARGYSEKILQSADFNKIANSVSPSI
jgi:uncharacterized protein YbjT (DUF2867 family)